MSKESVELRNISVPTADVEVAAATEAIHGKALEVEGAPGSGDVQRVPVDEEIVSAVSVAESLTRERESSFSTTSHPEKRASWDAMERKYLGR
jgi:hypothetical protein